MPHAACLVVNSITAYSYGFLSNCTADTQESQEVSPPQQVKAPPLNGQLKKPGRLKHV